MKVINQKELLEINRKKVTNIEIMELNHIACKEIGFNILPNSQCITPTSSIINRVKKYPPRKIQTPLTNSKDNPDINLDRRSFQSLDLLITQHRQNDALGFQIH